MARLDNPLYGEVLSSRMTAALATLDAAGDDPLARASRSWLLFFDGRCAAAVEDADRVVNDPGAEPKARSWAAAAGCGAAGFLGRERHAARAYERRAPAGRAAHQHDRLPGGSASADARNCVNCSRTRLPRESVGRLT